MTPRLRIVPPSYSQRAADPLAQYAVFIGDDPAVAVEGATAAGLQAREEGGLVRVGATSQEFERLAAALSTRGHAVADSLRRYIEPRDEWRLRSRSLPLDRTVIVGILNLTTDSFSGDGVGADLDSAVRRAEELRSAGATVIDVGAETARADRPVVAAEAEAETVARAVKALVREGHIVSVDTYKGRVAAAALDAGAEVVNDISGLMTGEDAALAAAHAGAGYVLNYSYSQPKRRPEAPPVYGDVVAETLAWFEGRVARLEALGMGLEHVALDPGIAFGKSHDEDLQVVRRIGEFRSAGLPLMLAHSRKNFIGSATGRDVAGRDLETHVATVMAYAQGVRIFRVHDVAGARRATAMAAAIVSGLAGDFAPEEGSWPWRAGAGGSAGGAAPSDKEPPPGQRW
jgi:dihydropteroate synthase